MKNSFAMAALFALCLHFVGCAGIESASNHAPMAEFSISTEVAAVYQKVEFDATASNDLDGRIIDYSWSFGDGTTGSGVIATRIYTTGDVNHMVVLTVTDNDGQVSTYNAGIVIIECSPCTSQ